ncbi:MAG: thioredoxin domain-containing protein [Bacteroidia bacterium]|nr:thioredoxin domain-containing protein [Bacteroidia bacterium]
MRAFLQFFCYTISASILLFGCNSKTQKAIEGEKHSYTNALINTSSPYLLQHAHNPVNWNPWGDSALTQAKRENKLLIISIGYAACHWCHVMEHESFEDTAVASLMNNNFVSIKVDREERPDIDQIYMNAAMLVNGRGGWPLNAIALPDGRPVFAGTYFPRDEWMKFLTFFQTLYQENPQKLNDQAQKISEGINELNYAEMVPSKEDFKEDQLNEAFSSIRKRIDFNKGGLSGAPKFPMPVVHEFLLEHHYYNGDPKALEAVTTTLNEMQNGGIYDQLRGGFARYSTDGNWKVPHFEKMLYDNGQLVSLYSKAYQVTQDPSYKQTVYETLGWIKAEMTNSEGAFYSSLDADSEGKEGKFYIWTGDEILSVLGEDTELFSDWFEVKKGGNWEGFNILHIKKDLETLAQKHGISQEEAKEIIDKSREKLLKIRSERIRPGLDDKVLTSWNALMLKGYVDAYKAFGEEEFLQAAIQNGEFILNKALRQDGGLNRNYKEGKSSINAFADDYSFSIEAFLALYQATFDEKWLNEADKLMEYAIKHFYDDNSGTFFYTSELDPELISRSRELQDNVIPSSNSSFAKALHMLGTLKENKDYLKKSRLILNQVEKNLKDSAPFFANYGVLMNRFVYPPYEVAIVGPESKEKLAAWNREFHAGVYLLGGNDEGSIPLLENKLIPGETYIYVCKDKVCKLPVKEVSKAFGLLN